MPALALYARTSTDRRDPASQLVRLREYAARRGGAAVEFVDAGVSGARARRPGLDALVAAARRREGDAVVVTKLDRLARSVRHLAELAAELAALGVDLVVLDNAIDTATPGGKLLFHVLGAVAEFERDLIRERVRDGMAAARQRGSAIGRPRALDRRGVARARRLRTAGRSFREIGAVLGVSASVVHSALAR